MKYPKPKVFAFNSFLRSLLEPRFGPLAKVQTHKMNYAVWRLGIAATGEPPFEVEVLAYPLGPFIAELRKLPAREGDISTLSAADKNLCLVVASRLGGMSGRKLALRSHRKYAEWRAAREGLMPSEYGNRRITIETVRNATFLAPKEERVIEADHKKVIMRWNPQFHVWNFTVEGIR